MTRFAVVVLVLPFLGVTGMLRGHPAPVIQHVQMTAEQQKNMHWGCLGACPHTTESHCVTKCEQEMYSCIDHTGPGETEKDTDKCQEGVLATFRKFGIEEVTEKKGNATAEGNSTANVTEEEKKAALLGSAPRLVARQHGPMNFQHMKLTVSQQKAIHWGCVAACRRGHSVESHCVTSCEQEMYQCIDHTGPGETEEHTKKCQDKINAEYKKYGIKEKKEEAGGNGTNATGGNGTSNDTALLLRVTPRVVPAPALNHVQVSVEQKKAIHWGCVGACKRGYSVESHCVTSCEQEMYQCIDHTGPGETEEDTEKCQGEIMEKYKKYDIKEKKEEAGGNGTNATGGNGTSNDTALLLRVKPRVVPAPALNHVQLDVEQKKAIHWGCVGNCKRGYPVESHCVTSCEVEMYTCIDHTGPGDRKEGMEKCKDKMTKKYKKYGITAKKEEAGGNGTNGTNGTAGNATGGNGTKA